MTNHRVRKVTVSTNIISTIAGTGTSSFSGDGGSATSATINQPVGIAVDASGTEYSNSLMIKKLFYFAQVISTSVIIITIASAR